MKEIIKMIIFVVILGIISAGMLTSIDFFTEEKVLKNEELKMKASVLDTFDLEYSKNNIEKVFDENIKTFQKGSYTFYQSHDNDVAFEFQGPGLWGPISGVIALKPDIETIKGIKILHQEETPGLGGVIAEKEYLIQFKDKKIVPRLQILKASVQASAVNEVDGISGATMTGEAFEELLNKEILMHRELLKKQNG